MKLHLLSEITMSANTMFRRLFARKASTYRHPKRVHRPRLAVQSLELRSLMSATFDPAEGILRIEGTDQADTIRIVNDTGQVRVEGQDIVLADGQTVASLPAADIVYARVDGLEGNDRIEMVQVGVVPESAVILEADGGAGNDTLVGGSAADRLYGGADVDQLVGGAGDDLLDGGGQEDLLFDAVAIDASALMPASFSVDYVAHDSTAPFGVDLAPGDHFVYSTGGIAWFKVENDGTISYDPALEGILSGQGTSALAVNGVEIQVDASALLPTYMSMDYVAQDGSTPFTARVLPGDHFVYATGAIVWFNVANDGTVNYDSELEGVLSGQGTNSLTLNGAEVQIDATSLLQTYMSVDYVAEDPSTPLTTRLLPGDHFVYVTGAIQWFKVATDGTISYDAALEGILSGQGTSSLKLNGAEVHIDASSLLQTYMSLDYVAEDPATPFSARLLPGDHFVYVTGAIQWFKVETDGTISYDSALEGILSGQGTNSLTLNGAEIQFDTTALLPAYMSMDYVAFEPGKPFSARLLPGDHFVYATGGIVWFKVNTDGTVGYDPTLEGILTGAGTNKLAVHGRTISVNPAALANTALSMDYVAIDSQNPFQVSLLPGQHFIYTSAGEVLYFTLGIDGITEYDPALEGVLSDITATLGTDGVLRVRGSNRGDVLRLVQNGDQVSVDGLAIAVIQADGTVSNVSSVSTSLVTRVEVEALDGADRVTFDTTLGTGRIVPIKITGGAGDDTLTGGRGNDTLDGGTGRDSIIGGDGSDEIHGGEGDDVIFGEGSNDLIYGDAGSDQLFGDYYVTSLWASGLGNIDDTVYGGDGNDKLYGGLGNDWLWGEDGNDAIYGDFDNDALDGGKGDDVLDGGSGNDNIVGGEGMDNLSGNTGNDTLWGASWQNNYSYQDAGNLLYGNDGNDILYGGNASDSLDGGDGSDWLSGENGDDRIVGGSGSNTLVGGNGSDFMAGGEQADVMVGAQWGWAGEAGSANDTMYGYGGNDTLYGGDGNDELHGGWGDDWLWGENGNDGLYGEYDNDALDGGKDTDVLDGGWGNDNMVGGEGLDFLSGGFGNDTLWGASWQNNYTYQDAGNFLYGNDGDDNLYGGNGNDYMDGGIGDDGLFGGAGWNTLVGGADDDRFLTWSAAVDTIQDQDPRDAAIRFVDSPALNNVAPPAGWPNTQPYNFNAGAWTANEIYNADVAFNNLHHLTANTRLLAMPSDSEYTFTRRGQQTSGDWNYGGQNDGVGNITIGQLRNATLATDTLQQTIYHEIGHSWGTTAVNSHFQAFLNISGWREASSSPGKEYSPSGAPGDDWWYLTSASFARPAGDDYSKLSPAEDWATTWETYFMDKFHGTTMGNNKVQSKYDNLDLLFVDLRG